MRFDYRNKEKKTFARKRRIIQVAAPSYMWYGGEHDVKFRAIFNACHEAAKLMVVQSAADKLMTNIPQPKHADLVRKIEK